MKCSICNNDYTKTYNNEKIVNGVCLGNEIPLCDEHTQEEIDEYIEYITSCELNSLQLTNPFKSCKDLKKSLFVEDFFKVIK